MAKTRTYPPKTTLGPGRKALTKRQKAEGIAKWAELLTAEKRAKAAKRENGQPVQPVQPLDERRENRPTAPDSPGVGDAEPRDNRPSPPNPETPVDPLFSDPLDWNENPERATSLKEAQAKARKTRAKGKPKKAQQAVSQAVSAETKPEPTPVEISDDGGRTWSVVDQGPAHTTTASVETEGGEKSEPRHFSRGGPSQSGTERQKASKTPPPAPPPGHLKTEPQTLTAKQARFVEEYLIDMNATGAARRAGYSKKSAEDQGYDNLRKPEIQRAIAAARAQLSERCQVSLDDITRELMRMGFANLADFHGITSEGEPYIDLSACTREQLAALQDLSVEDYVEGRGEDARMVKRVRVKLADKRGSLGLLAELLGHGAKRKVEMSGSLKVEDAKRDALAETIRRMETDDLRRYDELARQQDALLAKARPKKEEAA
jgi:phage terminase small subunit